MGESGSVSEIRRVLKGQETGADGRPMQPASIAGLFMADRADHVASEIGPTLAKGTDVICDRYVHSSLAYQGMQCDMNWVAAVNGIMRIPDLTLFVEVSVDLAARRRSDRGGGRLR